MLNLSHIYNWSIMKQWLLRDDYNYHGMSGGVGHLDGIHEGARFTPHGSYVPYVLPFALNRGGSWWY